MSTVAPLPLSFNIAPRKLILCIGASLLIHALALAIGTYYKNHFEQVDDITTIPTKNINATLIGGSIERIIVDERPVIKPVKQKLITTENTSAVVLPVQEPVIKPEPKKVVKEEPKPKVVEKPSPKKQEAASPPPKQIAQPTPAPALLPSYSPKPKYPFVARRRGIEGTVILEFTLLNNGSVKRVFIIESSGSSLLDKSALKTFKLWRFPPNRFNSIKGSSRQPITFRLTDS
ncbi:MAG: hypothetical protein A6F71_05970 [Cycloclasticus sp. symbiont of Poecilosclerida sp. M]|nr:MAG: hypothetical protein A6F71_05970 [Cycloclasticus sp. symbiont of Poecilosclerida sp. M]